MGFFKEIKEGIKYCFKKDKPYNGLYDDGRTPSQLTLDELYKAISSKNGHALIEWREVVTEIIKRNRR